MRLFYSRKEWVWFGVICAFVFVFNVARNFVAYQNFMEQGEHEISARVLYSEDKGAYRVLWLDAGEFTFYTTSRARIEFKRAEILDVVVRTLDLEFWRFLSGKIFLPNESIKHAGFEPTALDNIYETIASLHESEKVAEFYGALFLATPISSELRNDVARLGIAHLVAISGYHLGVIFAVIFFLFLPVMRRIYASFAPWRDYKFDLSIIALCVCGLYLALIGLIPSFLRAFFMSAFGIFMLARGVKILSYQTLLVCVCALIALFPSLVFNIGFYFSCVGVAQIFIYAHHFPCRNWLVNAFFINFYLFFAMQIPVLFFFPLVSVTQLYEIPATLIFGLFYPLAALAHIFGIGWVFDELVEKFLALGVAGVNANIKIWLFLVYNLLIVLAAKSKICATLLALIGAVIFGFYSFWA